MSQASHKIYKELVPLEKKYKYYKKEGRGGVRYDLWEGMLLRMKYDYLKKKLEYFIQDKYDDYQERIMAITPGAWGMTEEQRTLLDNKMNNDTELIQLNRIVRILKIQLINKGYKKSVL